jgi:O-antigen/teichoic acid export membrane protein
MVTLASLAGPRGIRFALSELGSSRLQQNMFWSVAGAASTQGSSLLAAVVVARMLGIERFGQLTLIQTTVLLIGTLGEMGFTLTTAKFVSRWRVLDPARTGRLIGWSLRATGTSALVMTALLGGLEPYLGLSNLAGLSMEIRAGCALLFFEMLNRVQFGALAGLEAFGSTARVQIWRGILTLPCVWIGTWLGGLLGAVLSMAFVSMATVLIGHWVLRNQCRALSIPLHYRGTFELDILTTSMSLWISSLLLTGSSWAVVVLLSHQPSGFSELGLYNAADKWKTALLFFPQMLFQVTLPMLSHSHAMEDYPACGRIIFTALASTVGVTGVGAIGVICLSRPLMLSYGTAFTQGESVLALAALVAVPSAIYTVGSGAVWALGKPTQMLQVDLCKTFLLMALCWMHYASSAWNLTFAYLMTFSVGSIVVVSVLYRELRIGIRARVHATVSH